MIMKEGGDPRPGRTQTAGEGWQKSARFRPTKINFVWLHKVT